MHTYALHPSSFFFYRYGHHRDLHSFPYTTLFRSRRREVVATTLRQPVELDREEPDREHREPEVRERRRDHEEDRKSTRLNSSHPSISYAVFCLKKKKNKGKRRIIST